MYVCEVCGHKSIKWYGRCPVCQEFGSFKEEHNKNIKNSSTPFVFTIPEILQQKEERIKTNISEVDRVFGGGVLKGSVILMGGEPGIGKSTLLLQMVNNISENYKVLYVSSEEPIGQIKQRAMRIKCNDKNNIFLLSECDLQKILNAIQNYLPQVIIIDSIQGVWSNNIDGIPGGIIQLKETTFRLINLSRQINATLFLVGHVTKGGILAGPKLLEHAVDVVVYLEYSNFYNYRLLRCVKNRFASCDEVGVFELTKEGFIEVTSPSLIFLDSYKRIAGSVLSVTMEGKRALLTEVQGLVTKSYLPTPKREVFAFDWRRFSLMLAVIEKILKINLSRYDVYANLIGGIQAKETALDLPLVAAIISSFKEKPLKDDFVILGEVGLAGEIRGISFVKERVNEAKKLSYKKFILPLSNKKDIEQSKDIFFISNLEEIFDFLEV